MNNDTAPSSAADLPPASTSQNSGSDSAGDTVASLTRLQNAETPAQKKAQAQIKKKHEFINSLMTNVDVMIYAELCILYYMEWASFLSTYQKMAFLTPVYSCSFFRLLIRLLAQMVFLTPKPSFIPPMPQHRPYIGAIFGPNIICILLHIFTARSEAGESMRGYLHGGIIIDLIGQKGPTSKFHLVVLDLLVCGLQSFMLAVHVEKERLSSALAAFLKPGANDGLPRVESISSQTHDAEERGIIGDAVADNGDIEMQAMSSRTAQPLTGNEDSERDLEHARLLDEPSPQELSEEDDDDPLDIFWSGTAVVADFHILETLRNQWDDYRNASASALQTVGFSAELANRRIAAAHQRFQRDVETLAN